MKFSQLAGHLEAYKQTKTTIDTLRLCNRFGKGKHAKVTKLPIELVEMIEQEILHESRDVAFKRWDRTLKCAEGVCGIEDHLGVDDVDGEIETFVRAVGMKLIERRTDIDVSCVTKNLEKFLKGEFHCDCSAHQAFRKEINTAKAFNWECMAYIHAVDSPDAPLYRAMRGEFLGGPENLLKVNINILRCIPCETILIAR